ncbi:MAG: hypothetical protein GQ532_18995 [Methylomarinum sp.]|nr:hypothetical protein [Methylomarinum sp.]
MDFRKLLIPATALSLALSGTALAQKPEGKGNPHSRGSDAYRENSNRQSDEFSSKGKDRAEERHYLKESKKHKKKEHKFKKKRKKHGDDRYERKHDRDDDRYEKKHDRNDDRYEKKHDRNEYRRDNDDYRDNNRDRQRKYYDQNGRQYDRYERQRYEERYQNNPIDTITDRKVNEAKSKIDEAHRRAIDAIDNTTKELTNTDPRRDRSKPTKPWWSIFGNQ